MGCCSSAYRTTAAVDALFTDSVGERPACPVKNRDGTPSNEYKIVRILSGKDALYDELLDVCGRAFCGSPATAPDPIFDWVTCGRRETPPATLPADEATPERLQFCRYMIKFGVELGFLRGGVYALVDVGGAAGGSEQKPKVIGGIVTGPPNNPDLNPGACEMMGILSKVGAPKDPGCKQDGGVKGCAEKRMPVMDSTLAKLHKGAEKSGKLPKKHLYLMVLALDPEMQGKGVGSSLMSFVCDVADADGVPLFFETAGAKNVGFYEKKAGCTVIGREVAECKGKGGVVWRFEHDGGFAGMLRPSKDERGDWAQKVLPNQ